MVPRIRISPEIGPASAPHGGKGNELSAGANQEG
jgi:hypothetical protein